MEGVIWRDVRERRKRRAFDRKCMCRCTVMAKQLTVEGNSLLMLMLMLMLKLVLVLSARNPCGTPTTPSPTTLSNPPSDSFYSHPPPLPPSKQLDIV